MTRRQSRQQQRSNETSKASLTILHNLMSQNYFMNARTCTLNRPSALILLNIFLTIDQPLAQEANLNYNGPWQGTWKALYRMNCGNEVQLSEPMSLIFNAPNDRLSGPIQGTGSSREHSCWNNADCSLLALQDTAGPVNGGFVGRTVRFSYTGTAIDGPCRGAYQWSFEGTNFGSVIVARSRDYSYFVGGNIVLTGGIGIIAPTPKPDVKSLGNSSCSVAKSSPPQPNPSCGNPINFSIGNKFQEVTDYFTAGRHPLHFTRYYNSRGDTNTHAASLGLGWRSNFDRYLRATLSTNQLVSMVSERADGRELIFQYDGTNWVTDADVIARLEASATGWALTDDEETVETYEFGEGGSISLVTIRTQGGYTQQF